MLGICCRRAVRLERQADALEQPHQIELALDAHGVEHLVGRIVLDADHHALALGAEMRRQPAERLGGDHLEFEQRRRLQRPPGERIGKDQRGFVGHAVSIGGRLTAIHGGCARLTPPPRWGSVGAMKLVAAIVAASLFGAAGRQCRARRGRSRERELPAPASALAAESAAPGARRGFGSRPRLSVPALSFALSAALSTIEYPGPNAKRDCVARYVTGAPPERHRDRAAHALLVGAGLAHFSRYAPATKRRYLHCRARGDRRTTMSKLLATCAALPSRPGSRCRRRRARRSPEPPERARPVRIGALAAGLRGYSARNRRDPGVVEALTAGGVASGVTPCPELLATCAAIAVAALIAIPAPAGAA